MVPINPFGLLFIGLGLILIVIGFQGSQHRVLQTLQGAKAAENTAKTVPAS